MAKLTIAQRREAQLDRFTRDYIGDADKARHIINTYYRYVALNYRVFLMENDANTCNTRFCKEESEKEERARKRLAEALKPYGLKLFTPWITPEIAAMDETTGAVRVVAVEPILYR